MKTNHPNMRRWSAAKLSKELTFAEAFAPTTSPQEAAWLKALRAESKRRKRKDALVPVVTIHDPRYVPMPHFANLP